MGYHITRRAPPSLGEANTGASMWKPSRKIRPDSSRKIQSRRLFVALTGYERYQLPRSAVSKMNDDIKALSGRFTRGDVRNEAAS